MSPQDRERLVRNIAMAMTGIAMQADDTLWCPVTTGLPLTCCEALGASLIYLGVDEAWVESYMSVDYDNAKALAWVAECVKSAIAPK